MVGDIERAIEESDFRWVRVGLVVEAPRMEADGPNVNVRVLRLGLFSARFEFLRTALGFMAQVRAEHSQALRDGRLEIGRKLQSITSDDGRIVIRNEQEGDLLRATLKKYQSQRWHGELQSFVQDIELQNERKFGEWLADLMSKTGIHDASSLVRWLVSSRDATGISIQRSRLHVPVESWPADSESGGSTRKVVGFPPLDSADVDENCFERWLGWKRFLTGRQIIPDRRGQDIDLAFDVGAIQRRIAKWYARGRERAAVSPGDVRVVVAGDGFSPGREGMQVAKRLLGEHEQLILDANVEYMRILHTKGLHFGWAKGLGISLGQRKKGASVILRLEPERAASVSVVMVMQRMLGTGKQTRTDTLEGWSVLFCGVVVEEMSVGSDYAVAMFTEVGFGPDGGGNPELVYFAREHCEGLLRQDRSRIRSRIGKELRRDYDAALLKIVTDWLVLLKKEMEEHELSCPETLGRRLGIRDFRFVKLALEHLSSGAEPTAAAEALWSSYEAWPNLVE